MEVTNLPDLRMISGVPFEQRWQFCQRDGTPIEIPDGRATAVFRRGQTALLTTPLQIEPEGFFLLSLTGPQVSSLQATGVSYQITIEAADLIPLAVWRGMTIVQ